MLFNDFLIQFKHIYIFNSNKFYLCMRRGCGGEVVAGCFTLNYYSPSKNSTKYPPMHWIRVHNKSDLMFYTFYMCILIWKLKHILNFGLIVWLWRVFRFKRLFACPQLTINYLLHVIFDSNVKIYTSVVTLINFCFFFVIKIMIKSNYF
jgi:hypothetical protein